MNIAPPPLQINDATPLIITTEYIIFYTVHNKLVLLGKAAAKVTQQNLKYNARIKFLVIFSFKQLLLEIRNAKEELERIDFFFFETNIFLHRIAPF